MTATNISPFHATEPALLTLSRPIAAIAMHFESLDSIALLSHQSLSSNVQCSTPLLS